MQGIKRKVDTLIKDSSCRASGLLLERYLGKCIIASRWRSSSLIHSLSDEDFERDLQTLESEKTVLTAKVCQAVLQRSLDRMWSEQR